MNTEDEPLTNTEMARLCEIVQYWKECEVAQNGCCGDRDGTFCRYLNRICPNMALAADILITTRGMK